MTPNHALKRTLPWRFGCNRSSNGPTLDAEDIAYTREVLIPYLDADDMRTCIECLFGDAAARTLGFTPTGLSPWAGLALALDDARPKETRLPTGLQSGKLTVASAGCALGGKPAYGAGTSLSSKQTVGTPSYNQLPDAR